MVRVASVPQNEKAGSRSWDDDELVLNSSSDFIIIVCEILLTMTMRWVFVSVFLSEADKGKI